MLAGIDIGYTSAKIAQLGPDGKPIPVTDLSFPEYTYTPSTLFLSHSGAMIGRQAEGLLEQDPHKSLIKDFVQYLGTQKPIVKISETEQWFAEAIYALLLKKLRSDIEAKTGQLLSGIVISIPPSFKETQKKALSHAAAMADIPLKALLPSPIVIALNALKDKPIIDKVLVVDVGGKFLRVALVTTGKQGLQMVAHKEIVGLHEEKFTQPIVETILQQFSEHNEQFQVSPFIQIQANKLAVALKEELMASPKDFISKHVFIGEYVQEIILYKAAYYEAIQSECQQIAQTCVQFLKEVPLESTAISACILAGGSSQIPLIESLLVATNPELADKILKEQPILGAAFGAAQFCNSLEYAEPNAVLPADFYGKSSINIGIRIVDELTKTTQVAPLISQNIDLPEQVTNIYYIAPENSMADFEIGWYSDKDEKTFTLLDTLSVSKDNKHIEKYQIELHCQYTEQGLLKVLLTDLQSTFFIKKEYPLFDEQTLLMLQQKQLVKRTMINNLG